MSLPVPLSRLIGFVEEDAPSGDLTSSALAPLGRCRAEIRAKGAGVIAGAEEAAALFSHFGIAVTPGIPDGGACGAGSLVMALEGDAARILLVEIAGKVNPSVRVAATRKTCPGMRALDKKAVVLGGGEAHRSTLSDAVLIKDNHLKLVPLEEAVRRARAAVPQGRVEIEVTNGGEAVRAVKAGAHVIMFDNMDPGSIREAIRELGERGLRQQVLLEASGGIGEANLAEYASLGLDRISVGALTHSARALDLSLEVVSRTG